MKLCSVEGCDRKHYAHGYCRMHHRQWKQYGYIKTIKSRRDINDIVEYEDYIELIIKDGNDKEIARTKIDKEDYERINICSWGVGISREEVFYVRNSNYGYLHKFILNCDESMQVDHINHDTLDNRKSNLRICTQEENVRNRSTQSNNKLGVKNIKFDRNHYQVRIMKDGKTYSKCFRTLEEAIEWRDNKLEELHGEFACKGE